MAGREASGRRPPLRSGRTAADVTTGERIEHLRLDVQKLTEAFAEFIDGGLTQAALLTLLQAKTKLPKKTIQKVLNGVMELEDFIFKQEDDDV